MIPTRLFSIANPKMPDWCQKRITGIELKVRFGDGKHRFYLESVCAAPVREGKLCDSCRMIQVQTKTQDVKTFPHGFVLGEYSEESHIFDGPWYHSKVEAYGAPSKMDIVMAMEAQRRARKGVPTKAMKDLIDILVAGAEASSTASEKSEEIIVVSPVAASPVVLEKPKIKAKTKVKSKAKVKEASVPQTVPVPTPHVDALSPICNESLKKGIFVESMDDPLEVEIIKIVLKKFIHEGVQYWKDSESETVYEKDRYGKKGACVGHWDSVEKCIVEG